MKSDAHLCSILNGFGVSFFTRIIFHRPRSMPMLMSLANFAFCLVSFTLFVCLCRIFSIYILFFRKILCIHYFAAFILSQQFSKRCCFLVFYICVSRFYAKTWENVWCLCHSWTVKVEAKKNFERCIRETW